MKKIKKILNVDFLSFHNGYFGFISNSEINIERDKFLIFSQKIDEAKTIIFWNDIFFILNKYNVPIVQFPKTIETTLPLSPRILKTLNNGYYLRYIVREPLYSSHILGLNNEYYSNENPIHEYIFESNIYSTYNGLTSHNLDGTLLWQYTTTPKYDYRYTDIVQQEIEEKAQISSVLGVFRDLVWLVLDIGVVIALDRTTGQEVHVLRVPDGHEEEYFTYSKNSILDEKTGIIFGAMGHFYWEIDISKAIPTYALFDIKESCDKHDIQVSDLHKAWDGADRLFVIQGGESNRVGYLSRKAKAIVWSTAIDEAYDKWPALLKVEYGGGRLYVLDHDNTLHVYGEETLS